MFYENDKAISNSSGRISPRTAANAALFELQFKGVERPTEAEVGCGPSHAGMRAAEELRATA